MNIIICCSSVRLKSTRPVKEKTFHHMLYLPAVKLQALKFLNAVTDMGNRFVLSKQTYCRSKVK